MAHFGNASVVKILSRFSKWTSGVAIGFGAMVLIGWTFHIQRLKGFIPGQVAVKANTGVCFVLLGLALWLVLSGVRKRFTRALSVAFSLMASLIGFLSFLEFWQGWDFGIDQLLFKAGPEDLPGSVRLALMSPIAALDFFLLGIGIALLAREARWARMLQAFLATIAALLSMIGLLDFILDPHNTHTHIAPLTAAVLLLVAFSVLCARTQGGLASLFASSTVGGVLCRHMLPSSILIPIGIAWVRWRGQQMGLYSEWTGVAIMTVSAAVLLTGLTVWTALALDRLEAGRERVEESARRLAAIVNSSNDAIIGKTLDGIVTSWNGGAEAIYGYSAEEMVGQTIARLVPPDLQDEFQGFMNSLRLGKSVGRHETERLRKDGKRIPVSISISPIKAETGQIVGASTIARDINERKQIEHALLSERRRFESVLDSLPVMVCLLRPDFSVAFANFTFRAQFGEAKGRKCYEFCFGQATPCEFCHSFDVLKEGRPIDWEVTTNDGRILHAFDFPFTDSDGSPLVLEMDVDVTEQKQAEEEIRKLNRELEERVQQRTAELRASEQSVRRKLESILSPGGDGSRLELRDLLDVPAVQSLFELFHKHTRIPMFVLDLKGEVVVGVGWQDICMKFHRTHPGACANCKESDMELSKGVKPGEFKLYKCKNNMWDAVTPIMLGKQRIGNLFCGQFFFADEPLDYSVFRAQARAYTFDEKQYLAALERAPRLTRPDVDTALGLFAKVAQMLSQLNYGSMKLARTVSEADRANAQLEAANRELEAFTYSVSHDLRAPLRHISGFAKILSDEFSESLPAEAQHHVQRIVDGTHRMGQLVDDLLDLGRVGRKELSPQMAGLRSIVDEVIGHLKPDIGDRRVEWKISDLPFVECDVLLMQQVFQNLLSNALKFTRTRDHAVIEIGQEQRDGETVVFVRDNGVGFSMKYADKLFGVFQRMHRAEDFEGTGVGLATVQRIIQKHGGRIWAEAELDKGAAFYFVLGAAEADKNA